MSTDALWNRREFVIDSAALGRAAAVSPALSAEPLPETTRIASPKCAAPASRLSIWPKRLIADGTDWRLLEQLKRELKT